METVSFGQLNMAIYRNYSFRFQALPIGPIVVPSWDYLLGF